MIVDAGKPEASARQAAKPQPTIDLMGQRNYKYSAPTELQTTSSSRNKSKTMPLRSRLFSLPSPIPQALLLLALLLACCGCVKRSRDASKLSASPTASSQSTTPEANDQQSGETPHVTALSNQPNAQLININTAPAAELEKLPGIGKGLAERIIEHRERFGPFRRTEHLIIVRGISDRRFRALRDLITVE
jgi:competence ComEA-like helix-hairpin-helix protein